MTNYDKQLENVADNFKSNAETENENQACYKET